MPNRLETPVREVLALLAEKRYPELESLTCGVRMKADDISTAVADYGRTIIAPPYEAFQLMDVVEVKSTVPPRWSITVPVWTKEEGRSDLSVELTVIEDGDAFRVELDDIHVL